MARIRFIGVGAVLGLTWAAALRGYMMQLAGPTSTFTFSGTFGIILPAGTLVGGLLGWAATLASSLFVALALACSIPMRT
jgi:hypothetical protein